MTIKEFKDILSIVQDDLPVQLEIKVGDSYVATDILGIRREFDHVTVLVAAEIVEKENPVQ